MKVLWITERFPPERGGVAASSDRQARLLAPEVSRLDVLHLTGDLPAGRAKCEPAPGAPRNMRVHQLGRAGRDDESLQLLLASATAMARANSYDLVLGFYAVPAGYAAVLAAERLSLPSIVSLRGNDLDRGAFQASRLPFLLWTLGRASAVACVSRDMAAAAAALAPRPSGYVVVPNSVDGSVFRPDGPGRLPAGVAMPHRSRLDDARSAPDRGLPKPWIGFSGELRLKKGMPVLLDLAETLSRGDDGTVFLIGGVREEERDNLDSWRRSSGEAAGRLAEIPYISGREALVSAYRAMDLFAFPSLWDGLPNALLEAMACAKPVIAAASGGIPDAVEDGLNGVLVAPGDMDSFPARTRRLAAMAPPRAAAMGRLARATVLERFSPAVEKAALLSLIRRTLRLRRTGKPGRIAGRAAP